MAVLRTLKFNQSARKSGFFIIIIIFFRWRMFKFKKNQRANLGPSSSDSVATLEKKFGKTFPGFV